MAILDYGSAAGSTPSMAQNSLGVAGQLQGLQANQQTMNQNQTLFDQQQQDALKAKQQQEVQAQQKQAIMQKGAELLKNGTAEETAQFMLANPEVKKQFIEAAKFKDGASISSRIDFAKNIISGQSDPIAATEERIKDIEKNGGDATGLKASLATGDPEIIKQVAEKDLAMLDSEGLINYKKAISDGETMTDYQAAMIEGRKADREISKLKAIQTEAKTQLQFDKLQQEIDKMQIESENKIKEAKDKGVDLDFEVKAVQDEGQGVLDLLDKIEGHEGLGDAVGIKGASSMFGLLESPIAGTAAADVVSLIENLEAKNFITAVGQFKAKGGAGSLSDSEGKKLSASLTNLSRAQTVGSFKDSLNEVRRLIQLGMDRTKQKQSAKKSDSGTNTNQQETQTVNWSDL